MKWIFICVGKLWPLFDYLQEQINDRIWSYLIRLVLKILGLDCRMEIFRITFCNFIQKLIIYPSSLNAFIYSLPQLFELFHFNDMLGESCYSFLLMSNHDGNIFGVFFDSNHSRLDIINLLLRIAFTKKSFFNIISIIVGFIRHFHSLFGQRRD